MRLLKISSQRLSCKMFEACAATFYKLWISSLSHHTKQKVPRKGNFNL